MPRRPLFFTAALLLAQPAAAGTPCPVENLLPAYHAFEQATATQSPPERADAFLSTYARAHPGFFLLGDTTALDQLRAPAAAFFAGGTPRPGLRPYSEAALVETERAVALALPLAQQRFLAAFPDFRCTTTVVLGVSLGRFDGLLVPGNPPRLQFGLDLIARIHDADTLPALFAHELFHLYQRQVNPAVTRIDPIPVWSGLWQEGLATWVSGALTPALTPERLFWIPPGLLPRAEAAHRALAAALLADVDATGDRYDRWFTANGGTDTLPARGGYYLGYRLASELARTHSAAELARMPPAAVRAEVIAFLQREAVRP